MAYIAWSLLCSKIVSLNFSEENYNYINGISISKWDNCYILKIWIKNSTSDITSDLKKFCANELKDSNCSIQSKVNRPEF